MTRILGKRLKGVSAVIITIYEYILVTQPGVLLLLGQAGLLVDLPVTETRKNDIPYSEIAALMRHDRWKRVRGALRQVYPGRVIG